MASMIYSWNNWDPLKRVVLGGVWGAQQSEGEVSLTCEVPTGLGWYGRIIEEAAGMKFLNLPVIW